MRGLVELAGHVGVLLGHVRVALLHARSGLQQRCGCDGLHVADCKHRVAVAGEDDLALLGELETALHGADRLCEHGAVGRAAATTDGAAAAMEQGQVDVVRFGPLGDALLRGVQGKGGGGRAGVLRGVGVAEHDFHLAAGGLQTSLDLRDLDHFLKHVHRVLQILKLLEQRNHVDGRNILGVGERQTVQLIHVLDVLGALGEGDDVTAGGLDAIALLDGTERAEGVEHLVGHRLQLATLTVQAMLADVLQSAGMHDGMLTELHLDHVEAEGLGLPDEVLQRTVGGTLGVGFGEGALHGLQIGDVVLAGAVHEVGVAVDGGLQTVCHDQHDGAVQLLGGDQRGLVGQTLAHFLLVVPQGLELGARRGGLGLHRQVLADAAGFDLQRAQHMVAELAGHLTAHLGGDVRVAVTVGTDPASRMEERRAHRRHEAGLVSEDPVVETTVDLRNGVEQRVVEDVKNGVGFLNRSRLLQRDRGGAEQRVDLVEESTGVFLLVRAAEQLMRFEQLGDAADLAFHGLTAGFGRMRGEHRMELELVEQLLGPGRTHLVDELVVGAGHFVHRIDGLILIHGGLALVQHGDAVVLLAQVGQMEVGGEGASQQLGVVDIHLVDDVDHLLQVVLIGIRVGQNAGETFVAGLQRMFAHFIELGQQVFIEFAEHLAKNLQAQIHFLFEGCGKITLLRALGAGAGRDDSRVRRRDLFVFSCHQTSFSKPSGCSVCRSFAAPPRLFWPSVASPQP